MKTCNRCNKSKPDSEFVSLKTGKPRKSCDTCSGYFRKGTATWRKKNPEKDRAIHTAYVAANRQKMREYDAARRVGNEEKYRANATAWNKANPHKVNERNARRRAARINAEPPWLSDYHIDQIEALYLFCQQNSGFHVDHIVPLQGKNVCGLHVPWNLQILTAEENMRKGNRF